jgi:hypothetical protein
MTVEEPMMRRGPGYWKMDVRMLEDKMSTEQFKTLWDQLKQIKHAFPNAPMWWERGYSFSFAEHRPTTRETNVHWKNYYYECIYERLQKAAPQCRHT